MTRTIFQVLQCTKRHSIIGNMTTTRRMSGSLSSNYWTERSPKNSIRPDSNRIPLKHSSLLIPSVYSTPRLTFEIGQRTLSSSSSSPFASNRAGVVDDGDAVSAGEQTTATTTKKKKKTKRAFTPRKAAVQMTDKARTFFKKLLDNNPQMAGIMLNYDQSSTGEPRMVFTFDFVKKEQLHPEDEGVSLEVLEDGSPKSPIESQNDGLPKLYVHHNAFLKVLGANVDVNLETIEPILYDREGNKMDPNA